MGDFDWCGIGTLPCRNIKGDYVADREVDYMVDLFGGGLGGIKEKEQPQKKVRVAAIKIVKQNLNERTT